MRRFILAFVGAAILFAAAYALRPAGSEPQEFQLDENVAVPMRDGVVLRADVLRPKGEGRYPVLVYRTPYGKIPARENYPIFRKAVARGYAVVAQDARGRYASDGEYMAYQQEGRDGHDTIEWAARQPWSNGAVGTFGLSYPGAVQWLAAVERPPHLKAMVPAMTFSSPRNFFYSGGVFDMSWIGWIWNNIAPDVRAKKNLPGPKTGREARAEWAGVRERLLNHLPLAELPDLKGVAPWYYEWMKHEPWAGWWDWCELQNKYDRVAPEVAVLNFSGWYDEAYGPEGATTNFNGLLRARAGQQDPRVKLIMGPWAHGVPGPEDVKVGARDFGAAALIDYDEMVLRWMDCYVRGFENGVQREKRVRYFVMGANQWREADQWPPPGMRLTPFFLSRAAQGKAGRLSEKAAVGAAYSEFVSEAANPVRDPQPPYSGAADYSSLAGRGDVLLFDSEPMDKATEFTGPIRAEIYLSTDAPDTDLWVRLLDVAPDGTALNLMSPGLDVVRASYRNQSDKRELLERWRVYRLELKNLMTSHVFAKGHRIRVQVSASFFPNFSRNLHTGELESVSSKTGKATIRIHHEKNRESRILLPMMPH